MKRMIAFAIAVFAFSAQATIVTVSLPVPPEFYLWHRATAMSGGGYLGGGTWARQVTLTKVMGQISGNSGGGAGNTVITITDGTNSCTATFTCASTQSGTGIVSATLAGTCTFPANASITSSVTTAGCTTTQPTLLLNFWGRFF